MVPRVDVPIQPGEFSCFFSFLFFSVSLPMASQGRSLVFSAILIETHSSSAVRSKKKIMLTLGEQQMALYEHRQDQGCHISHTIISQNKLSRLPFGFPFHNSYSPYSSLSNSKIIFEYHPTLTSGSNHSTSTGI